MGSVMGMVVLVTAISGDWEGTSGNGGGRDRVCWATLLLKGPSPTLVTAAMLTR